METINENMENWRIGTEVARLTDEEVAIWQPPSPASRFPPASPLPQKIFSVNSVCSVVKKCG